MSDLSGNNIWNPGLGCESFTASGRKTKSLHTCHQRRAKSSTPLHHCRLQSLEEESEYKILLASMVQRVHHCQACVRHFISLTYFHTLSYVLKSWFYNCLSSLSWWIINFTSQHYWQGETRWGQESDPKQKLEKFLFSQYTQRLME